MSSSWHGFAWHGMHGMAGQGAHVPFKGQHSHGMLNFGHNKHQHMMAQGQWHSVPGFGSHGQKWANMPGVWHKVSSFGSHGHVNNARDFRRDWQAGGAWGGGGVVVGDICLSSGICQGVWQQVPQSGSRASQSRSFRRDWQVDGEL
jgi:hypothetical protein